MASPAETRSRIEIGAALRRRAKPLLILFLLALCLRAPFIKQAFQLDDNNYLAGAQYVQTDPLHPSRTSYVFQGVKVDMRGHPHPPFNVLFLGLAVKLTGGTAREVPLHAVYFLFTLLALWSAYLLAERFTSRPLLACLLLGSVPAFVVHGNALEADIPLLALWLSGTALFVNAVDNRRPRVLAASAVFLAMAALDAYQAILLVPILGLYVWLRRREWRAAWLAALTPVLIVAAYQLYDRTSNGTLPASVLMGHFRTYGTQDWSHKWRNFLALTGHLSWILFPLLALAAFRVRGRKPWAACVLAAIVGVFVDSSPLFWVSFALGVMIVVSCAIELRTGDRDALFLRAWILIFYAGALVVFFAGAARYLLPIALPLALLAVRKLAVRPRWLAAGFALQLVFSLGLAFSHYQQSNAYRAFVVGLRPRMAGHNVWVNGEWGLKYYAERYGAKSVLVGQQLATGDWILTSRLGYPVPVTTPGGHLKTIATYSVKPRLPLRLLALNSPSAFSTITWGVRPFNISRAPADELIAETVDAQLPLLSYLPMNAPEASEQIRSGIYGLEEKQFRWMAGKAVVSLRSPGGAALLSATVYVPPNSPARRVEVLMDGASVARRTFAGSGLYTITTPEGVNPAGDFTEVIVRVDKTFQAPGDPRELGVVLYAVGFRK